MLRRAIGYTGDPALKARTLAKARLAGVAAARNLTLERGVERATFRVTDFASASNVDDPSNWCSLWF